MRFFRYFMIYDNSLNYFLGLSSRPSTKDPATRETEGEWRDPDNVSTANTDSGNSTQALSPESAFLILSHNHVIFLIHFPLNLFEILVLAMKDS